MRKRAMLFFVLRLVGPEDCALRFAILNGWFGAPPIWVVENRAAELVDGRTRLEQWHGPLVAGVHTLTPRSTVRALCAAGEYERAAGYVPANLTPAMLAPWAGIPIDWAARMQIKSPRVRSNRSERKDAVVRRVRTLLETADAGEPVTAQDLRWALGRFAEYSRRRLDQHE